MNILLGSQSIPSLLGVLFGAPVLSGTLSTGPTVFGSPVTNIVHDIVIVDGKASLTGGLDQRVDCVLRTFLGEFWLDPSHGVPYFEDLLVKNPSLSVIRQALLVVVQGVPGVTEVTRLDVTFDRLLRILRVSFDLKGTDETVSGISEVSA